MVLGVVDATRAIPETTRRNLNAAMELQEPLVVEFLTT